MTIRLSAEQICRVNVANGGDGKPRDSWVLPVAIANAYGVVWSPRSQQWELEYQDPLERAVHLMLDLLRYRVFQVANTATAIRAVDILLAADGLVLTLDPERAASWAEQCTSDHMRSPKWLLTWLRPWVRPGGQQD